MRSDAPLHPHDTVEPKPEAPRPTEPKNPALLTIVGIPDTLERWTVKRRVALLLELLRGETTAAQAARKHSLTTAEIEGWKEALLSGAENALLSHPRDEEAMKEAQIEKQKVGALVMERDGWTRGEQDPPFRR